MKVTKSKLKRIITEELQNILAEQSVDPTVYVHDLKRRRERAQEREALKKFLAHEIWKSPTPHRCLMLPELPLTLTKQQN